MKISFEALRHSVNLWDTMADLSFKMGKINAGFSKLPGGVGVNGCSCVLAQLWIGDLSRMYPAFHMKLAGIGSSFPVK